MKMPEVRRKSISLIISLTFLLSLFPLALPAFAADYTRLGTVNSVDDDVYQTLNTVIIETSAGELESGDSVIISLPSDFDFNNATWTFGSVGNNVYYGDYSAGCYIYIPTAGDNGLNGAGVVAGTDIFTVNRLDDNEISITMKQDASATEDSQFFIYMKKADVDEGFQGDINLNFNAPSGSGFDDADVVVGRVARGEVCVEVIDDNTFGDESGIVTIRIKEDYIGALEEDDASVQLTLPGGFVWDEIINGKTITDGVYGDGYGISIPYGAGLVGTINLNADGRELSLDIDSGSTAATCIKITATINADKDNPPASGDIIAEISGESDVSPAEIKVGVYNKERAFAEWGFNDGKIPEGFQLTVLDNGVPGNSVRFPNNEAFVVCETEGPDVEGSRQPFSLCGTSWFEPSAVADRWVITSPVTLPDGCSLKWDARSGEETSPEDYRVLISTSGNNPEHFKPLVAVEQESNDWTAHDADLSSYQGQTVYLAFQLTTDNGAYLWLDNIQIVSGRDIEAPLVSTLDAGSIGSSSATLNGTVTPGNEKITGKGFECKSTTGAQYAAYPVESSSFTCILSNLVPKTNYTFRAYAATGSGKYYGLEKNFTTAGSAGGGGGGGGGGSGESVGKNGGTVKIKGVTVEIPQGAVKKKIKLVVAKVDSAGMSSPNDYEMVSSVFEITKDRSGDFEKDISITIPFDKNKVEAEKDQLAIFFWDEDTRSWVILENTEVDWSAGTVSGTVGHLTKFAVLATNKGADTPLNPVAETETKAEPKNTQVVLNDIRGHWAENSIRSMVASGAASGYSDGSFKPNQTITRAEFAKIIVKAFNLPYSGEKVFQDTKGHWAEDAISAAYMNGIISGYDENSFGPDDTITREQIAVMVVKAAKLTGTSNQQKFSDGEQISKWAKNEAAIAAANQLIFGYEDNTFRPKNNASRAEAVSIITRALNCKIK